MELLGRAWLDRLELREEVARVLEQVDLKHLESIVPVLLRGLEREFFGGEADRGPSGRFLSTFRLPVRALARLPDFVERAMGLVHPNESWDSFECVRASLILDELELELRRAVHEPPQWTADPRWMQVAQTLGQNPDAGLSEVASRLRRALEWFAGCDPFARVLPSCLIEFDEPLVPPYPLVAIGFEVPARRDVIAQADEFALGVPEGPRLSLFAHQYGGHACRQVHVLGFGVDLEARDECQVRALATASWGSGGTNA